MASGQDGTEPHAETEQQADRSSLDPEIRDRLEAALAGADDWFTVAQRLAVPKGDEGLAPHRAAFSYDLVGSDGGDRRQRFGPLAPVSEWASGTYPAPLDRLPPGATKAWTDALTSLEPPLAKSRYGDLLWLTRAGDRPHELARIALAAYETLADGDDGMLTATNALQRGIELAMELNDRSVATRLADFAVGRAESILAAGGDEPGVVMMLLEAAAGLARDLRPARLSETILKAEAAYQASPDLGDAVADLLASVVPDPAVRTGIRRRQLARWEAVISSATGLVRQVHLQHALELASLHQLADVRESLRHRLQEAQAEPLDLHEVGVQVPIPGEEIDRVVAALVGDDGAISALRRLGAQPPVSDLADIARQVNDSMGRNPIRFLSTGLKVGDENVAVRYLRTPEEHFDAQVRETETLQIRLFGSLLLVPTLARIAERYGVPDRETLSETLAGGVIDPPLANALSDGIAEYFRGHDETAAHLIAPRLERAFRQLGRQVGVVVIREPIATQAGGVRPLGAILADLVEVLPENWRRYFANLLTDELGLNLRNRIAHGLIENVAREDAALLVHAALAMSLLRISSAIEPSR